NEGSSEKRPKSQIVPQGKSKGRQSSGKSSAKGKVQQQEAAPIKGPSQLRKRAEAPVNREYIDFAGSNYKDNDSQHNVLLLVLGLTNRKIMPYSCKYSRVFEDDEPKNGISRYVILTGFDDAKLLSELCRLNVDVHSIIRLKVEDEACFQELLAQQQAEKMWGKKVEEKYPDKAEAEKLKLELRERKLNEFWQQVNILMRDNPNGMLGNIATLDYRVKPELLPDSLVKLESRNVFGMKMFDELSVLLYDLIDFRRQWENYLKHLKVISLPEFRELTPSRSADFSPVTPTQTAHIEPSPGEEDSISNKLVGIPTDRTCNLNTLIDMRTYSQTLEGIAVEDTSIELILHAIVEQVSALKSAANLEEAEPGGTLEIQDDLIAKGLIESSTDKTINQNGFACLCLPPKASETPKPNPPMVIHPHDKVTYLSYFGSDKLQSPTKLKRSLLDVISTCYPDAVRNTVLSSLDNSGTFESKDESSTHISSSESLRRLRCQQLVHFARKSGWTREEFEHELLEALFENLAHDLEGNVSSNHSNSSEIPVHSAFERCPFANPYLPYEELVRFVLYNEEASTHTDEQCLPQFGDLDAAHTGDEEDAAELAKTEINNGRIENEKDHHSQTKTSVPSDHVTRLESAAHFEGCSTDSKESERKLTRQHKTEQLKEILAKIQLEYSFQTGDVPDIQGIHLDREKMRALLNNRLQNLSDYCIEEPMECTVMLQRLQTCRYELPWVDIFNRGQNGEYLVIAHHPFERKLRSNNQSWKKWFHAANIGFRAYLQHLEQYINSWTKQQEAEHYDQQVSMKQMDQVLLSLAHFRKRFAQNIKIVLLNTFKKGDLGKSEITPIRSGKPTAVLEKEYSAYIANDSLKAIKKEQEEQKEGEYRRAEGRGARRLLQSETKSQPPVASNDNDNPNPTNQLGSAANESRKSLEDTSTEVVHVKHAFLGYDVMNIVPHWSGETTHLFPTDGATVKTQQSQLPNGESVLRVSLLKDGHVFTMHRLDGPVDPRTADTKVSWSDGILFLLMPEYVVVTTVRCTCNQHFGCMSGVCLFCTVRYMKAGFEDSKQDSDDSMGGQTLHLSLPDGTQLSFIQSMSATRNEDSSKGQRDVSEIGPAGSMATHDDCSDRGEFKHTDYKNRTTIIKMRAAPESLTGVSIKTGREETEVERYLNKDGVVISLLRKDLHDTSEDKLGIRLLFPSGDRMETNTTDWEALKTVEQPVFASDATQQEPVAPIKLTNVIPETRATTGTPETSRRGRLDAAGSGKKGQRTKKENEVSLTKENSPLPSANLTLSESIEGKSEKITEEVVLWLVTLAAGTRYWLKTRSNRTDNDSSTEQSTLDIVPTCSSLTVHRSYDPATGQTVLTRPEDSLILWHKASADHINLIVQHPDGTRQTQLMSYQDNVGSSARACEKKTDPNWLTKCKELPAQLVIRTECPGFPTIMLDHSTGELETSLFAQGTEGSKLFSTADGRHLLMPGQGGEVNITSNGRVFYTSSPKTLVDHPEVGVFRTEYAMRYDGESVMFETTDPSGNMFSVDNMANCNVLLTAEHPGELFEDDSKTGNKLVAEMLDDILDRTVDDAGEVHQIPTKCDEHTPRFFLLNTNTGNSKELMRLQTVVALFSDARHVGCLPANSGPTSFEESKMGEDSELLQENAEIMNQGEDSIIVHEPYPGNSEVSSESCDQSLPECANQQSEVQPIPIARAEEECQRSDPQKQQAQQQQHQQRKHVFCRKFLQFTAPQSERREKKAACEALKKELQRAAKNREALKTIDIPNYFRSKEGLRFLLEQVCLLTSVLFSLPLRNVPNLYPEVSASSNKTSIHDVPLDEVAQARRRSLNISKVVHAFRPHRRVSQLEDFGGSEINLKQALIEDPVRRKVLLTSLIGGPKSGQLALKLMRGLRLQPSRLDFGKLHPGQVRNRRIRLLNWGPETAYFRVKPPVEGTGLQVLYKQGPIPPGLSRTLEVTLAFPEKSITQTDFSKDSLTTGKDDVNISSAHERRVSFTGTKTSVIYLGKKQKGVSYGTQLIRLLNTLRQAISEFALFEVLSSREHKILIMVTNFRAFLGGQACQEEQTGQLSRMRFGTLGVLKVVSVSRATIGQRWRGDAKILVASPVKLIL
ncbi:sperm-associated antigen 17, partial [Clonorchis sinensis]